MILAFPGFSQPWCAWIALVPWFVVLQDLTPCRAFWWSYLVGLAFFLGSMWWLVHVTVVGWLVLCTYLALYFGVFGWCVVRFQLLTSSFQLLFIPSSWIALEFARSHVLSGFGWNLLGYSQTSWLPIIQIADATGVWGVSFLVVMVNVAVAAFVRDRSTRAARWVAATVGLCLLAVWSYGHWRLRQSAGGEQFTVAVVQGNIPQEQKWDEASKEGILQQYERLTHEVASPAAGDTPSPAGIVPARSAAGRPDLIIWPETSVPGFFGYDPTLTDRLRSLAVSVRVPLLVGAPVVDPERGKLLNSAVLIDADGGIRHRYDKLHLVPFGEFVPGEAWMPWLRSILPPIGDFIPGQEYTVFQLPITNYQLPAFSVLICFEDIFPHLARHFVRDGAQWLVVITNDAWFGKTAAAYQHAQASTFRAVELRVPVVRAANTGWSGCITESGRWIDRVRDAQGEELFVEGVALCDIAVRDATTLYERWGDWWAMLCVLIVAGSAIIRKFNANTRRACRGTPPEA